VERFLERNHNVRFHIGAAFGCCSASAKSAERGATASAAKKRFKEIAEPSSVEFELNSATAIAATLMKSAAWLLLPLPLGGRLKTAGAVPIRAELIIFLALFRIAQNLVRFMISLNFSSAAFLSLATSG